MEETKKMTYSRPKRGPPASFQAKCHINEGLLQAPVILSCVFSVGPGMKLFPPSSEAGDGENKGIEEINSISISEVSSFGG